MRDEGRPLGAGVQAQASNHLKLRWSRAIVGVMVGLLQPQPALAQTKAYVAATNPGAVLMFDTAADTLLATIPVGLSPDGIVVTPDGNTVYVTDPQSAGSVFAIDTATNTVIATITVGSQPRGIAVTPDGSKLLVANVSSDTLSVIDTATNTVVDTIAVGNAPIRIAMSMEGTA